MPDDFKPTEPQQAIIDFIRSSPDTNLMVDARAGAAKTSTIVMAAQFIGSEFSPLAVAFNKKIADELSTRLPPWFQCRTLNALGHQAWSQARGKRLIVDADKLYKLTKSIVPPTGDRDDDSFTNVLTLARTAKSIGLVPNNSPMKVKGLVPDEPDSWDDLIFLKGLQDVDDTQILQAKDVLAASIKSAFNGEIDFDDQIYMSVLFGGTYPRFHTVIVDESQDLSPLNHIQLRKMTGTRLIAVGDPHQAIYAFRGADQDSMRNLADDMGASGTDQAKIGKGRFHELPLSASFRVPKSISLRQREHVEDFTSMDFLPEGEILSWPLPPIAKPSVEGRHSNDVTPIVEQLRGWSLDSIPAKDAFVLCRSNAPLMRLAFALIKARRPVKILGRDIGASLASLLTKICSKEGMMVDEHAFAKLDEWKTKELAKVGDSESKRDLLYDRYDALHVLLDASGAKTTLLAADFIRELFSDKADDLLTLSSGHRAKGLERKWVMHLDPHRIPSKWAEKASRKGNDGPLVQEYNLRYVIETRSQHTLVLAALEDCLEIGE